MFDVQSLPWPLPQWHDSGPGSFWVLVPSTVLFVVALLIYSAVYLVAPIPRPPLASEVTFRAIGKDGKESEPKPLPCWQDRYLEQVAVSENDKVKDAEVHIEAPEVFMSVVVPAYNEEERLQAMLQEAVEYLDHEYASGPQTRGSGVRQRKTAGVVSSSSGKPGSPSGWEILVVSDGSTDKTESIALDFARSHPQSVIRVVKLEKNRGKGGAVVHGMRHVRGQFVVFADADGASRFKDLGALVQGCQKIQDSKGRGVAIGSRAHLVGSEAVVNRSMLRNFLMHSFHMLLWVMTPEATSKIKDTQCGFKLFSREALPYIVPHMHSEGWIFDVEMLMLAERAQIPMAEVPIGWHEVKGSKLNVILDSLGMAWGLLVLRLAWGLGVYQVEEQKVTLDDLKPNANVIRYKEFPKPGL